MRKKIAIIGAGFAGIYCALQLTENGCDVTLFEREDAIGGLLKYSEYAHTKYDAFYHNIFPKDKLLLRFLKKYDAAAKIVKAKNTRGIITNSIQPFNGITDYLKFKDYTFFEKVSLFIVHSFVRILPDFLFENIDAIRFFKSLLSKSLFEKSWGFLFSSKFGDSRPKVSLRYIARRFKRTETRQIYSLDTSFNDFFTDILKQKKIKIKTVCAVTKILKNGDGYDIYSRIKKERFNAIISTVPFPALSKLYPLPTATESLKYIPLSVMNFISPKVVSPFFFNTILNKKLGSCVVVNMNAAKPFLPGLYLHYTAVYGADISDKDKLTKTFVDELHKINPDIKTEDILHTEINSTPYGQPVWQPGFAKTRKKLIQIDKNFYASEYFLTYPDDRSLNAVIKVCDGILRKIRTRAMAKS